MTRASKVFVTIAAVGAGAVVFLLVRGPVLLSISDHGELQPAIVVLNPLRDREPEKVAERVLRGLRDSDVSTALAEVRAGTLASREIAENERKYRLKTWKLVQRQEVDHEVVLTYRTLRSANGPIESSAVLTIRRIGGRWQIQNYAPVY